MPRFELPPDLTPEEERIVLAAIERMLEVERPRISAWALSGRAEALRLGALQARRHSRDPWIFRGSLPFTAGGTRARVGRGDSR